MLERNYEKFLGGPAKRLGQLAEPRVTINRKGLIYLNRKAYESLGSPKAVSLYYSREDDSIAIEPAYPRFAENFPVITKQEGHSIHAASFCRHFGISVPNTERFLRPDLNKQGALILGLRE
ncbi:MAG: hypothetical protein ABJB40_10900, partial [Acidobacteriota bacterium]